MKMYPLLYKITKDDKPNESSDRPPCGGIISFLVDECYTQKRGGRLKDLILLTSKIFQII